MPPFTGNIGNLSELPTETRELIQSELEEHGFHPHTDTHVPIAQSNNADQTANQQPTQDLPAASNETGNDIAETSGEVPSDASGEDASQWA